MFKELLRAALVYTYTKRKGEGRIEFTRMPLFTKISYADSSVHDKAVGLTKLEKTSLPSYQIKSW